MRLSHLTGLLKRIKGWLNISISNLPRQFKSNWSAPPSPIPWINNVVSDAWTPSISMVTALNYRWLASPWECFYSLSAVIGRWAVCAAWQSAAFRVIVSLGSSAQGQDRILELPEAASSLFRRNLFFFSPPSPLVSTPKRASQSAATEVTPQPQTGSLNREAKTSPRGCRHHGESDGRSRARSPGFFFFYIVAVQDNSDSSSGPALMPFRVSSHNIA